MADFRITGPGGDEIHSLADWFRYAPPKQREKHWRPGRSAMECARAWLNNGLGPEMPSELSELLDSRAPTRDFRPKLAIPELVTRLDDFRGEHRNHDVMVVGVAGQTPTLIAIEAKADESFGDYTVEQYLRRCERRSAGADVAARARAPIARPSNAGTRIKQLCAALFGQPPTGRAVRDVAKPLRYQLVAALAGALIETRARSCQQAVFIVHEFLSDPDPARGLDGTRPTRVRRNAAALEQFIGALATNSPWDGRYVGPLRAPGGDRVPGDVAFFIGKASRRLN